MKASIRAQTLAEREKERDGSEGRSSYIRTKREKEDRHDG